ADFLEGDRTDARNGVVVSKRVVTTREYTSGTWRQRATHGRSGLLLSSRARQQERGGGPVAHTDSRRG
ncbi:MAG: hypothetical protein ABL982_21360, partial [Vicinamibacterales bacterium]